MEQVGKTIKFTFLKDSESFSYRIKVPTIEDKTTYIFHGVIKDENREDYPIEDNEVIGISKCFIATALHGTPGAEKINVLREFRDQVLLKNGVGAMLVSFYYKMSPPIASFLQQHDNLRAIVRATLIEPTIAILE